MRREARPLVLRRRRRHEGLHDGARIGRLGHRVEQPRGRDRPDAGNQLRDAEARHAPARVLRQAQHRQQVLHVRGLEKLEAAVLDEGDVAPRQLEFERRAVASRCGTAPPATSAPARLRGARARGRRPSAPAAPRRAPAPAAAARPRACRSRGSWRGARAAAAITAFDDVEDRLGRAVVALQRDDARGLRELLRKVEDVAHRRAAERVDRLRVVADHRDARGRRASARAGWRPAAGWCPGTRRPARGRSARRSAPASAGSATISAQYSSRSS